MAEEKKVEKHCPIMSRPVSDRGLGGMWYEACMKGDCEWWDEGYNRCVLVALRKELHYLGQAIIGRAIK